MIKEAIINALKAIIGLIFIPLGMYSLAYGYSETSKYSDLYFFAGFLILGFGIFLIVYVIRNAKN